MVEHHFNLKADAGAIFRNRLAAVALSGSLAVAAADPGSLTGVQPHAS